MQAMAGIDTSSGDGEKRSSTNKGTDSVKLPAEQVNRETQSTENKRILIVASVIPSCNVTVITTVTTNDGVFGQVVIILSALAFSASLILIVALVVRAPLSLDKVKQILLVPASFFTLCSFLAYVAMKMEPIAGTAAAAIFFSGALAFSLTIWFLFQAIFGDGRHTTESLQPCSSQPLLTSAPPPAYSLPQLTSATPRAEPPATPRADPPANPPATPPADRCPNS